MSKPQMENRAIGIVFLVIGLLLIAIGIIYGITKSRDVGRFLTAKGTITSYYLSLEPVVGRPGKRTPAIETVEFVAVDGKKYSVGNKEYGLFPPRVGSTRSVVYDKNNPQSGQVRPPSELWVGPPMFITYGVVAMIIGLLFNGILFKFFRLFKQ